MSLTDKVQYYNMCSDDILPVAKQLQIVYWGYW